MKGRMVLTKCSVWLFAVSVLSGCGLFGGGGSPAPVDTVRPVLEENRLFYDDGPGGFPDSTRTVVKDASTWRAMWDRANSMQATAPALPEIDFSQEMVLLVSAGRKLPGDRISVDSVGMRGEHMVAVVLTSIGCHKFRSDIYPVEIVRVTFHEGPVSFQERQSRAEC